MKSKLDEWIDSLDDDLPPLGENEFGFTVPEQVENHNASFSYLRAGLNKVTKALRAIN